MADPRKLIRFDEIDYDGVTMLHDGSIVYSATAQGGSAQVGKAVAIKAHQTVGLTTTGLTVFGKLILVNDDGTCTVQMNGFAQVPATGTYTNSGQNVVGSATAGAVRPATTGDELADTKLVVDGSDAANVWIKL